MSAACPPVECWLQLVDRQLSEERAESLRLHAQQCSVCRQQLAEVEALVAEVAAPHEPVESSERSIQRVMNHVRRTSGVEPQVRALRWPAGWRLLGAVGGMVGVAAAVLLLAKVSLPAWRQDGWTPRGVAVQAGWEHRVGTSFHSLQPPGALEEGENISSQTPLVLVYRNLEQTRPVYLLAFAVDARGEVHWLYPAHLREQDNEPSVQLAQSSDERPMPEAVVLESPALGMLKLIAVLSDVPMHVQDIESLPRAERSGAGLKKRWPQSIIREQHVILQKGTSSQ